MTFPAAFMTTDPRSCADSAVYVVLVFFCDKMRECNYVRVGSKGLDFKNWEEAWCLLNTTDAKGVVDPYHPK